MIFFKLAWRNLWRNKKRSFITIFSIAIAIFLSILMRSMQVGLNDNMIKNIVGSYVGYIQVHGKGYWEQQSLDNALKDDKQLIQKIQSVKGVKNVVKRIETFSLAAKDDFTKGVLIQGIEIEKEQTLSDWNQRLIEGELFDNSSQDIILAKGVAKYFKAKTGDTIIFIGQGYHGMSAAGKYNVCGIVDMKNPKLNNMSVFMPLKLTQDYLSASDMLTNIIINKTENTDDEKITNHIKNILNQNTYEIMNWREMLPDLQQTIVISDAKSLIMILILYMIITFGIFGTVLMMTQERIYEFGIMIAIGTKRIKLITTLIIETILLTLNGIAVGIILSYPIVLYYHYNPLKLPGDQAEVIEQYGFEAIIPFSNSLNIPFTQGIIIFCISLIIALYPTLVIWKLKPLKALKR